MKKLLIILICMFVTLTSKAQTVDSAYVDSIYQDLAGGYDDLMLQIEDLNDSVQQIHLNLEKAHEQYRYGTLFIAAGVALQGLAIILDSGQPNVFLSGVGSLSILGGMTIWVDSHRHIGTTRGKKYYYTFRGRRL